jgi:FecR protein
MNGKASGGFLIFQFVLAAAVSLQAAQLKEARLTQVIHDVKLLGGAAPKAATVSDSVREGMGVRTGLDSRAELTFSDLTITRLGENTVFSFNEQRREVTLDSGALLLQVPKGGAAARINSAVATAAISGGTALFEANKGYPVKLLVLEGKGVFCSREHPEQCETALAGQMVTMNLNGEISKPQRFNIKKIVETSRLLLDFAPLPNLDLILLAIEEQWAEVGNPPNNPPRDPVDIIDQHEAALPPVSSSPPAGPSKFGPPPTITSPDPYVIDATTQIQTDPTITTNGVTNNGTIYRDQTQDGPVPEFLFGSSRPFDDFVGLDGDGENGPYAVFKFANLQLAGDPIISTDNGGAINLALVSVGPITSGSPGGTLTFSGMERVFIGTQDGSINLGPEISFNLSRLHIYARGTGAALTIGSQIVTTNNIELNSEGEMQINGDETTDRFEAVTGGDFLVGTGQITARTIDIRSLSNINIDGSMFPNPPGGGDSINVEAGQTLNIAITGGGTFGWDVLDAHASTINLTSGEVLAPGGQTIFDFSQSSFVSFDAHHGNINAHDIEFFGHNLTLDASGNIDIHSAITPLDEHEQHILDGSISASNGVVMATGSIFTGSFAVGSAVIGGQLRARFIFANTDISAAQGITAVGGDIDVRGNLTSTNGTIGLAEDSSGAVGNILVGGNIFAGGGLFTPGFPVSVTAIGSITAPAVSTGDLHALGDMMIDNTAGNFTFGIIANHIIVGGTLFMINSPSISPNNGTSPGHDGETFNGFTMMVGAISSTGPTYPTLSSDGGDANPNFADSNPGNGGHITITTTVGGLSIGDGHDLNAILARGGAYNPSGPFTGGNGGTVDIVAAGDVLIENRNTDHAGITATTGVVSDIFSQYAGNGGIVNITTPGQISVNGNVRVSSDDAGEQSSRPTEGPVPGRESASGGNINLTSNRASGVAINVTNSGQLLSLLSGFAPGAGGRITVLATGASSEADISGRVQADRGTVDIRQTGDDGAIALGGPPIPGRPLGGQPGDFINMHGDIVKVGALGTNGMLTIGAGNISADTILQLYAGGSNGTLRFVSDVTLSSGTAMHLAANTITIDPGFTVSINGNGGAANVYTNHPDYNFTPGPGYVGPPPNANNGSFGGDNGAHDPVPLASAPPFDPPRPHRGH